jgi:hypothetical protein
MISGCYTSLSIIVWRLGIPFQIKEFQYSGGERFLMEKHESGSDATRYSPKSAP